MPRPAPGPPWRIGYFGVIRCRRSLECLSALVRSLPGLVEVDVRGKIASSVADQFDTILSRSPGMAYHGAYRYPDDLASIYGQVHLSWVIDCYEAGLNSSWLLPNRLYEGGYYRAVPIAMRGVETGRWLDRHGLGLLIDEPIEQSILELVAGLTPEHYQRAAHAMLSQGEECFITSDRDCSDLTRFLCGSKVDAPSEPK